MRDLTADLLALREQVDELTEENRQLRDLLVCKRVETPHEWGLTKAEARILKVLASTPVATFDRIIGALWGDKVGGAPETARNSISIRVHNIRRKIPDLREGIRNVHGEGYALVGEARNRIKAEFQALQCQ